MKASEARAVKRTKATNYNKPVDCASLLGCATVLRYIKDSHNRGRSLLSSCFFTISAVMSLSTSAHQRPRGGRDGPDASAVVLVFCERSEFRKTDTATSPSGPLATEAYGLRAILQSMAAMKMNISVFTLNQMGTNFSLNY